MEGQDLNRKSVTSQQSRVAGLAPDPYGHGLMAYTAEFQTRLQNLPVYTGARKQLQNPDGTIIWSAGTHTWEQWPDGNPSDYTEDDGGGV